jgi:hypothetical protein
MIPIRGKAVEEFCRHRYHNKEAERAILAIMNDYMPADYTLADGGANAGSKLLSAREHLLQGATIPGLRLGSPAQ